MKILHVINSLATGGAEKLLLESIPKYESMGLTIDVVVLNGTEYPFFKNFKQQSKGKLFSLGRSTVYNPLHVFRLIQYLKKYDIVHVHLFPALYWVALAKWIGFSKAKFVYTEHSTHNRRRKSWLMQMTDRFIYSKYDALVCITNEVNNQLQNHLNFPDERFLVIQNGIDLTKIENAQPYEKTQLELAAGSFLLIQVSSFRFPKDQATVIRSLPLLPSHVHLLLVGEGPGEVEAKQLAENCNVEHRVHFLGVRLDVPQLLKTADAVILSSEYEGLSLSSIEGMASGKPFIASDVPGLREMVEGAGILFPYKNEEKLAEIINGLLADAEKRNTIANNCQQKARQFDSGSMVGSHVKLYQQLVENE